MKSRFVLVFFALLLSALAPTAWAQANAPKQPWAEYDKLVKATETVAPLKSDLFGDSVSLYSGATEFMQTDISLPGNAALPVRLGRRYSVQVSGGDEQSLGGFGAWEPDVPYITATMGLDGGWRLGPGRVPTPRCSAPYYPPETPPFLHHELFSGAQLYLPGRGEQPLLWLGVSGNVTPADGQAYYWATRDGLRLRCTTVPNYGGEGFVAVDRDGTRTVFNHMILRAGGKLQSVGFETARTRFYLMATRVEDRFGNWVEYRYAGDKLTGIVGSDGREIALAYAGPRVIQATAHNRVWQYRYANGADLSEVVLPDQTRWRFEGFGLISHLPNLNDGTQGEDFRCLEPLPATGVLNLRVTHPSGAVGSFAFEYMRHGISGTPIGACVQMGGPPAVVDPREHWVLVIPNYFYTYALTNKTIAGAGIAAQTWTYGYGQPLTEQASYGGAYCTACDEAKLVTVTEPDGTVIEHEFGALFNFNTGRLLGKYTRAPDGTILRAETYTYVTDAEAATMPFVSELGYPMTGHDRAGFIQRPLKHTRIQQDGRIAGPQEYQPPLPPPPPPPCPTCPPLPPCPTCPPPPVCDPVTGICMAPTAHRIAPRTAPRSATGAPASEFTTTIEAFDLFARPLRTRYASSLGAVRIERTEYHDALSPWVLDQVRRTLAVDVDANGAASGALTEVARTEFDARSQPHRVYSFGALQQTLTYHADGTLATVTDGRDHTVRLFNWKRGIPRLIRHPATPEAPAGATESAEVNDHGWITAVTDEADATTCYAYDAMGRLAAVTHPSELAPRVCDNRRSINPDVFWHGDTYEMRPTTADDWRPPGIAAGQWRRYEGRGRYAEFTYYDALWRPVLTFAFDTADAAGTMRATRSEYDADGRITFQSYPTAHLELATTGIRTEYDRLDRVVRVVQDSELGPLTTFTDYLDGLRVKTTNPRGFATTTRFMAWGQPGYDLPIESLQPEGKVIRIDRHPHFGWPRALTQQSADGALAQTRRYVFDGNGRLCKTIEPETGATVTGHDAAGNPTWQAAGLTGGDYANPRDCNHVAASASGRVVLRQYDPRNRLSTLTFPDGRGDQLLTYTADNLPASIATYNGTNRTELVVNAYAYNQRRMLTGESVHQPNAYTWSLGYNHDASGNLAAQTYPTGLRIDYAPNALGQATQAGGYAANATYYPNGALKRFTYGNGLVHTMQQNARQLPARVTSTGNALDYGYAYDRNANPTEILNHVTGTPTARHRWMQYDGLDRLTQAASAVFGGSDHTHRFTYDALDNLESWKHAGVKDYADYVYDQQHRLTGIRNSTGATIVGIGYDPQGNVRNKNGQIYDFDFGNRLRSATGKESYRYDGHGRRVQTDKTAGHPALWQYSQGGQLLYDEDGTRTTSSEHVYLAGSVIATRERNWATNVIQTKYQHTDALGSPVAVTNEQGQVIERNDYEPYGAIIGKPTKSGIGYTGHVMDGGTGMTYMQQRYYDQSIGRFLSVDPVAARPAGDNFNRYQYANSNPYKFIDPDGREAGCVTLRVNCFNSGGTLKEKAATLGAFGGLVTGSLFGSGAVIVAIAKHIRGPAKESAEERAKAIHGVLDPRAQNARTTAVTETKEGVRVVSSSERRLTPAQRAMLKSDEVEGVGQGHAETTGINAAKDMRLNPTGTAASRPICPSCAADMKVNSVKPLSPLKKVK
jgi:RHS repeat-associated protein